MTREEALASRAFDEAKDAPKKGCHVCGDEDCRRPIMGCPRCDENMHGGPDTLCPSCEASEPDVSEVNERSRVRFARLLSLGVTR